MTSRPCTPSTSKTEVAGSPATCQAPLLCTSSAAPPSRLCDTCPPTWPTQFSSSSACPQPGQGLTWEPGCWGPFPRFSTDLLCDLGRSLPLSGPQCPEEPKAFLSHGGVFSPEIYIALFTPAVTTARELCPLKTFSQGLAVCRQSANKMSLVYTQTATSPSPTLASPVLGLPKCPRPCFLCHRYLVF